MGAGVSEGERLAGEGRVSEVRYGGRAYILFWAGLCLTHSYLVWMCVCEGEGEREKECASVCVCVCVCERGDFSPLPNKRT